VSQGTGRLLRNFEEVQQQEQSLFGSHKVILAGMNL
jgi:hypothetical protein